MSLIHKDDHILSIRKRVDISVQTFNELLSLPTFKRRWSISVGVYADSDSKRNGIYRLIRGHNSESIQDNNNWVKDRIGSTNYQTEEPPNELEVNIGDTWTETSTNCEFRLIEYYYHGVFRNVFDTTFSITPKRYWVETTSPGADTFLRTFTNSFDYTFDRCIECGEQLDRPWDMTFDLTFGRNQTVWDRSFNKHFGNNYSRFSQVFDDTFGNNYSMIDITNK